MSILLTGRTPFGEELTTGQFLAASAIFGAGSLLAILFVKTRSVGEVSPNTGIMGGVMEGVSFIYSNRPVGIFIVAVMFHCALVMSFDSILPVFSRDNLGSSDEFILAILVLSFGIGSVVGTFFLAGTTNESAKGIILLSAGLVSAIAPVLLGFSLNILTAFSAKFLMGVSQSIFMALAMTYVQTGTPDRLRGRISSLYILHAGGIMAFANLGYGNLADIFGAPEILIVTGVIFLAIFIGLSSSDPILKSVYKGRKLQSIP